MMNLLALTLLLSSLAAAGIFSPPPDPNHDVIREGHRLIVVEFERQRPSGAGKLAQQAKEDFIDAASVLPNVGQGLSQPPTEKLCDAKDACEEKTSIKNKAAQLEESVAGTVKSVAETTKQKAAHLQESIADAAKSATQTTKQKASHLQEFATDAAKAASETTRQKAAHLKESAADTIKTASETTKEKADQLQESAADAVKSAAEAAVDASKDVAGNISASAAMATEAARHNLTDILRRARDLGRDTSAFVGVGAAARSAVAVAHLLGFSTAYGACVWVTFASSHLLAFAMPRQQFGIVQSRLFPAYFRFVALCIVFALAGHFLGRDSRSVVERTQGYNLVATLATVLVNLVWLEPRATKAMFERMKLDKEEGRGRDVTEVDGESAEPGIKEATVTPMADAFAAREATVKGRMLEASKTLKWLNNCSSFLNALTLMGLSWHLVHLAQCLA